MADLGIRSTMLVKDVMSSPVISVYEDETVHKVAQLMDQHNIGCVIVSSRKDKPLGIITEKNLVVRVLAKNTLPSKIKAKEVMSAPLITIEPDKKIIEAARNMSRQNIRRLGVLYKGNIVGLITSKDVLAVTPELIEIIQEKNRIENENRIEEFEDSLSAGYCDSCEEWSQELRQVEGSFICEDCRLDRQ
jgi:signal-transduction protein with cAMP-binding, CBS, and nucleotidyltransferase domain